MSHHFIGKVVKWDGVRVQLVKFVRRDPDTGSEWWEAREVGTDIPYTVIL